ncbi:MAG TPA: TolC family protein [Bacteroidales bacterium]|nr:TolC family protein [Bacteroidales bacterium]
MKRFIIPVVFVFLFFNLSHAQDNSTLRFTIKEARDFALENNRSVQTANLDLNIANQKIRENLSTGLPQLSIDANYLHQFTIPEVSFGPVFNVQSLPAGPITGEDVRNAYIAGPPIKLGVRDNTVIDFTLSQLVFSGQYLIALKTAKIVRELSEKSVAKTSDKVKQDVEVAYYSILVLQENIRLLKETETSLARMYDEISGMNQQGLNEETDVDQVNVNMSNVHALVTSMELQLDVAYKQLRYLLGVDFDRQIELADSLNSFVEEENLMYLSQNEFNIDNSLDFQMINIQENVNEKVVSLEKSKYLPTISAFYRHEEQTNQPAFNFAVKDVIGATFNLPIFSGGLRSSRVNQAKSELQKTRLSKQDSELGLTMEYENARNNYQTAYSNFQINRQSMDLSKKIYDRTFIKYREGVSSSIELTQVQNQFITAESNYYNSMLSLLRSKAELDRILRINQ